MSSQAITRKPSRSVPPPPLEELLTPREVANLLKVNVEYIHRHHRKIGSLRLGNKRLRFRRESVDKYMRQLRAA